MGIGLWSTDGAHSLLIRCWEADFEFFIVWDVSELRDPASRLSQIGVRHKIDDGQLWELAWSLSVDGTATFYPSGEIEMVIRRLFNAERFVVQVQPEDSEPIAAVFRPVGIYWAIKPVLAACDREIN